MNKDLDIETAEQNLCDTVNSLFEPTDNFETAELYLSNEEFYRFVKSLYPLNTSVERLQVLMQYAGFFPTFNEFNNKHYWLLLRKDKFYN